MLNTKIGLVTLCLVVAACSAQDPDPSPVFDGRYVGTRHSDRLDGCGIGNPVGTTSALVAQGHLTMPLFGPKTQLEHEPTAPIRKNVFSRLGAV
jgi:hypothetical protein